MLVCARVVSVRAIRSARDACAAVNEAEVAENVRTASMMAKKSRGDIGICCDGDGAVEVTGAGGSDEAGFVEHGATGIGTGEGESGTGGEVGNEDPSVGTAWEGYLIAGRSSARSSSTSYGVWR